MPASGMLTAVTAPAPAHVIDTRASVKGRDPRGRVAPAEMASLGLRSEPELNREADTAAAALPTAATTACALKPSQQCREWEHHNTDTLHHRFDLCAQEDGRA